MMSAARKGIFALTKLLVPFLVFLRKSKLCNQLFYEKTKNTNLCPFLLDRVVRICVFLCGKPRNPRDSVKTLCQDN